MEQSNHIFVKNLKELDSWLRVHHDQKDSMWLVYYKPTTQKSDVTYTLLVDMLLMYGWIDSAVRKVDEERTSIRISPRNPKSNWSRINKEKISRLTKAGSMKPSGIAAVSHAKKSGTWDALNDVENLVTPPELTKVLKETKKEKQWEAQSRSIKRGLLEQLHNAKKPQTKAKLVQKCIAIL
jgi:uncharacterized protein YdeI (YjbR/CyaY-like superfamily)